VSDHPELGPDLPTHHLNTELDLFVHGGFTPGTPVSTVSLKFNATIDKNSSNRDFLIFHCCIFTRS